MTTESQAKHAKEDPIVYSHQQVFVWVEDIHVSSKRKKGKKDM